MNITHFKKREDVKKCLVYLNGEFPPRSGFYVEKDLNLPMRLYPNAVFYIRCNTEKNYMKNYLFFKKIYGDRKFKLISDSQLYDNIKSWEVDVVWMINFGFIFFGGVIDNKLFDKWQVIQNANTEVHILFNEINVKSFEPLYDYVQRRNENFRNGNLSKVEKLKDKTDWSNVTLIANSDCLEPWVNDKVAKKCMDGGINLSYLSNKILYDLPDYKTLKYHGSGKKDGLFISNFTIPRVSYFNKELSKCKNVPNFELYGTNCEKVENSFDNVHIHSRIDNAEAKAMYRSGRYGFSIYIARGEYMPYLGATFFEPLLNGLPIFMWIGADIHKNIFKESPECYYDNFEDLNEKLNNMSEEDMKHLWEKQIKECIN